MFFPVALDKVILEAIDRSAQVWQLRRGYGAKVQRTLVIATPAGEVIARVNSVTKAHTHL